MTTTDTNVIETAVVTILAAIGETNREGLRETPSRVRKMYEEMLCGYRLDPRCLFTTFESGKYDDMIVVRNIDFTSMCVSGSTFVETPRGRIPISRLKHGEWIYCFDRKSHSIDLVKCRHPRITRRNARVVRIYMDKETLICTPDHKILTYDDGWVRADRLLPGQPIVAMGRQVVPYTNKKNSKVWISLSKDGRPRGQQTVISEARFVYDLINGLHKFAAEFDIHHKNGFGWDNRPSNLKRLSNSEHTFEHANKDGRGKREAERWSIMSPEERRKWEKKRKRGLRAVHEDSERREAMLDKRRQSLIEYWHKVQNNPELYEARIKNMGCRPNHRVIAVEQLPWREDVWCLDSPLYHNFFGNGICVHNCEHHMLPFIGQAHVAYIPINKVIGLSKIPRLVDIFAKRLQLQERLTKEITRTLDEYLPNKGCACVIEATHLCLACRGARKKNATMITSSLHGAFKEDAATRAEFLQLIKGFGQQR